MIRHAGIWPTAYFFVSIAARITNEVDYSGVKCMDSVIKSSSTAHADKPCVHRDVCSNVLLVALIAVIVHVILLALVL